MAYLWNRYPSSILTQSGDIASGALAYFYNSGTTQPLATYADAGLTTPNSFPVVASAAGVFAPIFMDYIDYRVRVTDANGTLIFDADGISNPAPPSSGGGGGITVDATQILQTGDPIWRLYSSVMTGFVRMNARTIGSAVSGATERANDDTQNLFEYLWNNLSDAIAPVSTGRGASAAADWASNKTIGIPTMQGYAAVGLDDMGGTAAQSVQVITTASVTNGSATATVTSATGLARGMYATIAGVAAGTITAISGTTITLSAPYGGSTNASAAFRASFYSDAQSVGAVGGAQTFTATTAELPSHSHTATDAGHTHTVPIGINAGLGSGGSAAAIAGSGFTTTTANGFASITVANSGSGLPSQIIQPSRLGCWHMKL